MTHQAIDKALKKWYKPLMAVVCLGLMFGHMVSITPSLTAMHIFIAITVALALLYKTTTSRIFLLTGGYFLIYGAWTLAVTLLWGDSITVKEALKFLTIPVLVIALLRVMLVSPREMLGVFFYVCIGYLLTMATMGYAEHFTGWHMPTSALYMAEGDAKFQATGISYNPNDYSVLLIMAALYILAYSKHFMDKKWHIIGYATIAVCIPLMLWNDCRTGLGVSALALMFLLMAKIKRRNITIAIIICATVAIGIAIAINWGIISPRLQIYGTTFTSLYDSYGLGFGINGDKLYLSELNNYDITKGLTDAHSYLLQILFTSGLPVFLLYCVMTATIMKRSSSKGRNLFVVMPILYLLLLFSPSSSMYLWTHYLFFCIYVCYAAYATLNDNKTTT